MKEFFDVEPGDVFVRQSASIVSLVIETISKKSCILSLDTRENGEIVVCHECYEYALGTGWEKL